MRAVSLALFVVAASAVEQWPGFTIDMGGPSSSSSSMTSSSRYAVPGFGYMSGGQEDPRNSKCDAEETFFERGIRTSLIQHPEFEEDKVKISLGKKKSKFMQVDVPFSHKANQMSLMEAAEPASEEDPMAKERAKMRAKKAWTGSRIEQAKHAREAELKAEKLQEQDRNAKKIDVWYVNMDTAHERKNCLERQFMDMPGNIKPNRFEAVRFPDSCHKAEPGKAYEDCLAQSNLHDCIEAGIDYASTATHGTQGKDEGRIRSAVISNWCGHKRLFQKIEAEAKNDTEHAKYVVILEDDVVLDRKYFMKVLEDFATKYENRDWDFVQIDPFGHKDKKDMLEHFRGKPVFKPTADNQCSQYWGFHAVLIKVSALPRINHWMSINQAIPIDWLPWRMPHGLSYSALVSRNPEAALNGNVIVLPSYCSSKVMKSTIGS